MDGPHLIIFFHPVMDTSAVANSEELLLNVGKDEKERGHSQQ